MLGRLPLAGLTRDHVVKWVKGMQEPDEDGKTPSSKTLANKRGFLAGALNAAVASGGPIALVTQRHADQEDITSPNELYTVGTLAKIAQIVQHKANVVDAGGSFRMLGAERFRVQRQRTMQQRLRILEVA